MDEFSFSEWCSKQEEEQPQFMEHGASIRIVFTASCKSYEGRQFPWICGILPGFFLLIMLIVQAGYLYT